MSLAFSAIIRRYLGTTSSNRNAFASALYALTAVAGSGLMLAVALQPLPASAQAVSEALVPAPSEVVSARFDGKPSNSAEVVSVMVELIDDPAAVSYANSLKASVQAAGGSFSNMSKPAQDVAISSAVTASKTQVAMIETAQQAILPTLNSMAATGRIVYRTKSAYNGVSLYVTRAQIPVLAKLPGVKAVHAQIPKYTTAATDIDFLGARSAWTKVTPNSQFGAHGENIKLAVIDTGLDYIHANFGGPGTPAAYASVSDTSAVPNLYYPTFKIPGGYDFAGDAYTGSNTPVPDPNPLDSNGHGTGSASLAAGLGTTVAGATYAGLYDNSTDIASLKISPGFAPKAFLYPIRVFGTSGSTNLVTQAINYAIDPNGDGNLADHMDIISMSLGANSGDALDPDAVAASNAGLVGAIVVSAAGNAGDSYYIVSSPSVGAGTLSVAATFNDTGGYFFDSNVTANSPPALAGQKYNSIYGTPNAHIVGSLTGNVVYAIPHDGSAGGVAVVTLTNAAAISGNICLIDRGVIGFAAKVRLCQDAGAVATVVVQSAAGSGSPNPVAMSLTGPPTSTIPAVMIGLAEGTAIEAQLNMAVPPVVNVTINNDNGFVSQATTAADTMPAYSSRGPAPRTSSLKPDISAPAEVVGVAANGTGSNLMSFNGTSSATPHVAGEMALLRQLHPTWTVEELMALAMNTATHDEFTGPAGSGAQYGVGRVGGGRIDITNASKANVVAYNLTDPRLVSMSFGIVEVPVAGSVTLNKTIAVVNKAATPVTYNVTYVDVTPVTGASFVVGNGSPVTINGNSTATIPVTFNATGSALKHVREAAATANLPSARHWLTEKTGYAVLTPTAGTEPTLRVALYASPKPVSSMHATTPVPAGAGAFNVGLAGAEINTGSSFATNPQDIVSLVKPFELQYANPLITAPTPPTDPNVIKYVGVTSDFLERGASPNNTVLTFLLEGFGTASQPEYPSSDKEICFTIDGSNPPPSCPSFIYLGSSANGTSNSNAYFPIVVTPTGAFSRFRTNGLTPSGLATSRDTNAFNNTLVTIPIMATDIGLLGAGGLKVITYQVVTFDRANNTIFTGPVLHYDLSNPGVDAQGGNIDPFYYNDLATTTIPVIFNGPNFVANASQGMILAHMHNGTGAHTDVVNFAAPVFQSAVSRRVHGGSGTFDLPLTLLPLTNPSTEPRQGPAQTIVFTFDKPITAATATVTEGVAVAAAPTFTGNSVVVDLTGVNNAQYVTVSLSNITAADGGSGGTATVRVGFLLGDVNGNRVVTVSDVGLVNAQIAQPLAASNFLTDVNASGSITVSDKGLTNSVVATALPAP